MEQNVREKTELQRELDLLTEERETIKGLLEKQRQEAVSLKVREAFRPRRHTLPSMCSAEQRQDCGFNSDCLLVQDECEEKGKENIKLMKEMGEMKEQNEKLQSTVEQQKKETERLKVCE